MTSQGVRSGRTSEGGRIDLLLLGGFLGAGKTTTMIRLAHELETRGERVAIATNDQGDDLVDTVTTGARTGAEVAEVTGGCFCCRFEDLADVLDRLAREVAPTVVIAEAVGSCTDLQATVVRPLQALHGSRFRVAPLVTLVDPARYTALRGQFGAGEDDATDLAHLFHHQLAEADAIALNKTDTLADDAREDLLTDLRGRFPDARVVPCSAHTGAGLAELEDVWWGTAPPARPAPFSIDYDRYAAAEAELAWANQVVDLSGAFVPDGWVTAFLRQLAAQTRGAVIGHVKVRVVAAAGAAKASLLDGAADVRVEESLPEPVDRATALVNARVAVAPERLHVAIATAVAAADADTGARSGPVRGAVFRPSYPVPRHRM